MRESESGTEQAAELAALRSSVETLMAKAKNASPDKLRKLRVVIEGLIGESTTAPTAEIKETVEKSVPSGIDAFVRQWNNGEAYEGGEAVGELWFVHTAEGRVYVLPNPSERNRYPGGSLNKYYKVDEGIKLGQQHLVEAAEICIVGAKDHVVSRDSYERLKRTYNQIASYDIKKGEISV